MTENISYLRKKRVCLSLIAAIFMAVLCLFSPIESVFADGGPHGGYTASTDACAGCHRTHTAPATNLLLDEIPDLCFTCHSNAGTGADTNVVDGIYLERDLISEVPPEGMDGRGLKGGGFINALMDTDALTTTLAVIAPTTSGHQFDSSLGTAWGNGAVGSGPGLVDFSLSCISCHNPHGGGTYRSLRPIPTGSGVITPTMVTDEVVKVYTVYSDTNIYIGQPYIGISGQISSWCSQCHTRYLAGSGSGHVDSGDPIFTYRHDTANAASCVSCHVAHGSSASMGNFSGSVPWPDSATSPNEDARSSLLRLDSRGVCAYCHVKPDGSVTGGTCVGCHNAPQDMRRAVVGEFPFGDPHAHYGGVLEENDCVVCHDQATHMDGYVDLFDPDGGAGFRFQQPSDLSSDPDLSNFCADCHDADGATRLASPLNPFDDGNVPPDVNMKFQGSLQWNEWYGDSCFGDYGTLRPVNSHHDISDSDQTFSGAKLECLNCHGAHNAGISQPLVDPFATTTAWIGAENDFCLTCHNGGTGPSDPDFPPGVVGTSVPLRGINCCDYQDEPWNVFYTWMHSAHGLDSKRGWNGYSGAPSYDMLCTECHDPHGSYTASNTTGNPYMIRDWVDGTMYIDDGGRYAGYNGPPWNIYGSSGDVVMAISGTTVGWPELCGTCHEYWVGYDWFHDSCSACQTCHGHGKTWGEYDWEDGDDDTPCPASAAPTTDPFELVWPDWLRDQGLESPTEDDATMHPQIDLENTTCIECHALPGGE